MPANHIAVFGSRVSHVRNHKHFILNAISNVLRNAICAATMPPSKNLNLYSNWVLYKEAKAHPVTIKVLLFKVIIDSKDQYACKWCNKVLAEHATHFKTHLRGCNIYIKRTMTKTVQDSNPFNVPIELSQAANRTQSQLNIPRLTDQQKKDIDVLAAMWCFLSNHSFNMFESPAGKKFLHALHPAYKAPSRKTLSGPLLDKVYEMTKMRTNDMISGMQILNIVTDESSNIRNNRICNISLHTPTGHIHYISEDIQSKQMTATAAAQWLRNHLITLTKGDIARINSIITDTCKLMFKMWLEIQKLDEFKHVLFIPCDSHGLQLLIGDLLKIPVFKEGLNKAQTVVKSFRRSLLQYARLRDFQLQYNKQH